MGSTLSGLLNWDMEGSTGLYKLQEAYTTRFKSACKASDLEAWDQLDCLPEPET